MRAPPGLLTPRMAPSRRVGHCPHDNLGGPRRAVGATGDNATEPEAPEAQGRFAAVVSSSSDAILTKSAQGIITSWNGAAERLYGYAAVEAIGRPISILVPARRRGEERQILRRGVAGGPPPRYKKRGGGKGGG